MPLPLALCLVLLVIISGCAEAVPTPGEQHRADMQATQTWIHGPLRETCPSLPGPESQRACALVYDGALGKIRGTPFTHQDHFRIELAKAKAWDEMRRLWTWTDQQTWLLELKARACQQAPLAAYVESCLKSVQDDVDALSRPDTMDNEQPVVRAERAVAWIEANEREQVLDPPRAQVPELPQHESIEPALMVVGVGGGLWGVSTATLPLQSIQQTGPQMPLTSLLPAPPVFCTSHHVGRMVYTNCY